MLALRQKETAMKKSMLRCGKVWRSLACLALILLVGTGCAGLQTQLAVNKANSAFDRQDYGAALAGYRQAADQGSAEARYHLGHMYLLGQGGAKNTAEAEKWLTAAADQGYAPAQFMLGLWYLSGDGITADPAKAAHWMDRAAGQGYALAQYHLGLMYASGRGVARDSAMAANLLKQAAAGGCPVAPELLTPTGLARLEPQR